MKTCFRCGSAVTTNPREVSPGYKAACLKCDEDLIGSEVVLSITPTKKELQFIAAYFECARFTDESEENGLPFCETWEREQVIECLAFLVYASAYLSDYGRDSYYDAYAQAGHDFWLSRNGHGTGFFDRDSYHSEPVRDWLQRKAEQFAEVRPFYDDLGGAA